MKDLDSQLEKIQQWHDSSEGKAYMDNWAKELVIEGLVKAGRMLKVEKYLSENNFDDIMSRLIKEHDYSYRDKIYNKGIEPYPNNKFDLLYSYIQENYEQISNELIPQDFLGSLYFVKGYWFATYCGQGCFTRIYDGNLVTILQI